MNGIGETQRPFSALFVTHFMTPRSGIQQSPEEKPTPLLSLLSHESRESSSRVKHICALSHECSECFGNQFSNGENLSTN